MMQQSATYAQSIDYDYAPSHPTTARTTLKVAYKPARWLRREKLLVVALFAVGVLMAISILWQNIQSNTAVATKNELIQKTQTLEQQNNALRDQTLQATNQSQRDRVAKKAKMSRADDRIRDINR